MPKGLSLQCSKMPPCLEQDRRTFLAAGLTAIIATGVPSSLAAAPKRFPAFDTIPDFQHSAAYVRNDLCEPQWKRGDLLMIDHRLKGSPGGHVRAKSYGEDPQVLPMEYAIAREMRIMGEVVGTYHLSPEAIDLIAADMKRLGGHA